MPPEYFVSAMTRFQVIQGAFVTLALGGGVEVLHLQITLCVQ